MVFAGFKTYKTLTFSTHQGVKTLHSFTLPYFSFKKHLFTQSKHTTRLYPLLSNRTKLPNIVFKSDTHHQSLQSHDHQT